jgi:hypothetical protein
MVANDESKVRPNAGQTYSENRLLIVQYVERSKNKSSKETAGRASKHRCRWGFEFFLIYRRGHDLLYCTPSKVMWKKHCPNEQAASVLVSLKCADLDRLAETKCCSMQWNKGTGE